MDQTLESFLSQRVVLDTGGPVVYLGTLAAVTETGFLLKDADVHDTRDGHATPEVYINEAHRQGISPNRKRLLVMHSAVVSISRLEDVVEE